MTLQSHADIGGGRQHPLVREIASYAMHDLKRPAPAQVYSEQIGNLMMDALSAKKYYHFVRLMGRAASHITLECALQTHPQAAIICEEVHQNNHRLADIVHEVCTLVAGQERLLMTWRSYSCALAVFLLESHGLTLCLFGIVAATT